MVLWESCQLQCVGNTRDTHVREVAVKCGDGCLRLYGYYIASVIYFACPTISSVYRCVCHVF